MSKLTIPDDLYQFQKDDVGFLGDAKESMLNLSEMGTGKTPVAIAEALKHEKTLVVCPKTLKLEWVRQINDWSDTGCQFSGRYSSRKLDPLIMPFIGKGKETPFFITNYETFRIRRYQDILSDFPFDFIILDEAHKVRNPRTKVSRGLFEFLSTRQDVKVLAMTGSPIVNNPADLYTLLCIVRPSRYSTRYRMDFISKYCEYYPTRYGIKVTGTRNMEELRQRTAPYTIRHTKAEVLKDFPEKYYRKVLLEMNGEQREVYEKMENELFVLLDNGEPLWAPSVLAQLMRLRQLNVDPRIIGVDAPSAKTEFLLDMLEGTDEKVVIFSCFERYIDLISGLIKEPHVTITGKVSVEDRAKAVKRFQEDDSIKYALGTVQSMGEGITLTASSNCIMVDRWWTPATNKQAEDRLHRIGQKNAVEVTIPVTEDSIDESLDKLLAGKEKLSQEYLGDQEMMKEVVNDLRESRRSK